MQGKPIRITIEQARCLNLKKQLFVNAKLPKGKRGAYSVIENLGYVQIDTISVIERSHHIVLYTRCPDYKRIYLYELQAKDKKIFEYWAHAASFIPMTDYRFYRLRMEQIPKKGSWIEKWIRENQTVMKRVRERILKEGPLSASNFEDVKGRRRAGWWDWKPAKMALEIMFWQGIFMIKERKKFQRVYDLAERVLPKELDLTRPSEEEENKFFIKRALRAMGAATEREINRYIEIKEKLGKWLKEMIDAKGILEVEVLGTRTSYYILPEDFAELDKNRMKMENQVYFLSPFDNLIILRDRTSRFFDFDYGMECYVPKEKRRFGYFCLPILWQDKLVGRIDPKADQSSKTLSINNLHIEVRGLDYSTFGPAFGRALNEFARFHNCPKIEFTNNIPSKIIRNISKYLP